MKTGILFFAFIFTFPVLHAQESNFSLQHDGKTRNFIFYSPCAGFDCTGKKLPLIFAFHGLTETSTAIKNYSQFNEIADTAGFAVIYAQGLNNSWNVGFSNSIASGDDDVGFVNAMIDYVSNTITCPSCPQIDIERIYSCGMSNGGFLSYLLACQLSNKIAAIASVTGCMTHNTMAVCNPTRPVPVFHIHGTADPIVPYTGGALSNSISVDSAITYWVNNNGCSGNSINTNLPDTYPSDGTTIESISYSDCSNSSEVLHYKINDGGHTWAGMQNPYPEIIAGKHNRDIFASEVIWLFFKNYSLNGATGVQKSAVHHPLKLYPNPATSLLNIEAEKEAMLTISDVSGKIILSKKISEGNHALSIQNLSSGIYFAFVMHEGGFQTYKVLKE